MHETTQHGCVCTLPAAAPLEVRRAVSCVPGSSGCPDDTAEVVAITTIDAGGAETYRQQIAAALTTW